MPQECFAVPHTIYIPIAHRAEKASESTYVLIEPLRWLRDCLEATDQRRSSERPKLKPSAVTPKNLVRIETSPAQFVRARRRRGCSGNMMATAPQSLRSVPVRRLLFAPIAEDEIGMLRVLSASTQLDFEPRQEAADSARLPEDRATRRLALLLASARPAVSAPGRRNDRHPLDSVLAAPVLDQNSGAHDGGRRRLRR